MTFCVASRACTAVTLMWRLVTAGFRIKSSILRPFAQQHMIVSLAAAINSAMRPRWCHDSNMIMKWHGLASLVTPAFPLWYLEEPKGGYGSLNLNHKEQDIMKMGYK